ncbi:hypothetical protein [Dactylosporangium sp. NPDC000521]|uniref:hypothetical protein n=1 Tax=Dactylosporangium sp. NPDC000521 TaxID=3363975 RepID=UPI0036C32CE6
MAGQPVEAGQALDDVIERRLVPDGVLHSGGVVYGDDYLNLHRSGVARALLDEALDRGWRPADPHTRHLRRLGHVQCGGGQAAGLAGTAARLRWWGGWRGRAW